MPLRSIREDFINYRGSAPGGNHTGEKRRHIIDITANAHIFAVDTSRSLKEYKCINENDIVNTRFAHRNFVSVAKVPSRRGATKESLAIFVWCVSSGLDSSL